MFFCFFFSLENAGMLFSSGTQCTTGPCALLRRLYGTSSPRRGPSCKTSATKCVREAKQDREKKRGSPSPVDLQVNCLSTLKHTDASYGNPTGGFKQTQTEHRRRFSFKAASFHVKLDTLNKSLEKKVFYMINFIPFRSLCEEVC